MRVTVVYATTDIEEHVDVELRDDAILGDAVSASGLIERLDLDVSTLSYAIYGQRASLTTPLAQGDRIELLRPLRVDPKDARRKRAEDDMLPNRRRAAKPHR